MFCFSFAYPCLGMCLCSNPSDICTIIQDRLMPLTSEEFVVTTIRFWAVTITTADTYVMVKNAYDTTNVYCDLAGVLPVVFLACPVFDRSMTVLISERNINASCDKELGKRAPFLLASPQSSVHSSPWLYWVVESDRVEEKTFFPGKGWGSNFEMGP